MSIFLGKILTSLRKSEGLSQIELANIFSIDKSTIAKYETDKCLPSIEMLICYAKHFDVTVDFILGLED